MTNHSSCASAIFVSEAALGSMDAPAFACTPDLFPDLMAAAINKQDIGRWAAQHEIVTSRDEGR